MADTPSPFSTPLGPDPAISLDSRSLRLPAVKPGPVHGAQFILEIAGPKSILAAKSHALLTPQWAASLGTPEVWVMAPADAQWRRMSTHDTGSYDSLALAWDMVGERGALSSGSAKTLMQAVEPFAASLERRVFPFPTPEEVDRSVAALHQAQDALDIGFELFVQGPRAVAERDIWTACAGLGFDLGGDGLFCWRVAGWESPVLWVAPVEEGRIFSLAQVQRGETHESLSIGFNVPTSPDPGGCLEAAFRAAETLATRLGGRAYDDEGRELSDRVKSDLRRNLKAALDALSRSGLAPGSPVCQKIFGG